MNNEALESALLADFLAMSDHEGLSDLVDDPLLQPDFDIVSYFNSNYKDEQSLENIQEEILKYDGQLSDLDSEIKECIRQQAYAQERTREQLSKINDEAVILIEKIQSVKQNAS